MTDKSNLLHRRFRAPPGPRPRPGTVEYTLQHIALTLVEPDHRQALRSSCHAFLARTLREEILNGKVNEDDPHVVVSVLGRANKKGEVYHSLAVRVNGYDEHTGSAAGGRQEDAGTLAFAGNYEVMIDSLTRCRSDGSSPLVRNKLQGYFNEAGSLAVGLKYLGRMGPDGQPWQLEVLSLTALPQLLDDYTYRAERVYNNEASPMPAPCQRQLD